MTAVVNLTGTAIAKAGHRGAWQQVSAQLLWTLSGAAPSGSAGQAVQSVEVELNGKPWKPPAARATRCSAHGQPWHPADGDEQPGSTTSTARAT